MSTKTELLDSIFAIYQMEKKSTWRRTQSDNPLPRWENMIGTFSLSQVVFWPPSKPEPRQINKALILLSNGDSLTVHRDIVDRRYEDAFTKDYFIKPLESFLCHEHAICLDALGITQPQDYGTPLVKLRSAIRGTALS